MKIKLPKELPEEQRERVMQVAAKCPVHRTLEGEVMFDERIELI
jgi:putative redox protein